MTDSKSSAFDPLDLCARILRREPAAEAELVDRFLPRVRTMVAIRTGKQDTMEDLSHEVMLEALGALRREMPRNPEMLAAFIFGITRNLVNGHFRRETRRRTEDISAAESIPDSNVMTRERELIADARREIENLEELDRNVLGLTLREGMDPAEIAEKLGLPAATVRQRKARALKRLLERLSRTGGRRPLQQ